MKTGRPLFLEVRAGNRSGAAMVAPFDARAVKDGAVRGVFVQNLALEDAAVFEREMKDVPLGRVRHGIEPHDGRRTVQILQAVTHTTQVPMTTM